MSQTVDRALTILASLGDGPASLEQAAARIGVHKSTALRLLRTLQEHGLVDRQPDQRYRLGGRLFSLAQQALAGIDVRQVAAPFLASLNDRYGHTVQLAVLDAGEVLYLDKVQSRYPDRPGTWSDPAARIGQRVPAVATAVGKVLLADLPEDQLTAFLDVQEFPARTSTSIRTAEEFRVELTAVQRQGWAVDQAEYQETVNCIAAPVVGPEGTTIAACSMSAPVGVAPIAELSRLLPELLCTVEAISLAYGGSPTPRWCENRCGAKHAAPASRT
ncbi:DNA-binding IclR family transcriptional regulator [Kitasatospora gansuensis]|uniref:DNA-binding IclR family transcriptional regulator n=1 Tax=Kitasatospora gansuensis TaxID=258050 RepID=A0A7W7WHJ4_9ACTN|nr:IclR family transcriptional regulator [Kitasatospora gansuensis]MBB4946785.1 DNA-binding IclR family transcriptional regulator [Kitasatospora gansuensis]